MAEIIDLVASGRVPAPSGPPSPNCACRSNGTIDRLTRQDMHHDLRDSQKVKSRARNVKAIAVIIECAPCPLTAARRIGLFLETGRM